MMEGSPNPKACKFSSENWKIIDNLKAEKRKLKEFNASVVCTSDESFTTEDSRPISPAAYMDETSCQDYFSSNKPLKTIKIEKYLRPSLCDLKTFYNQDIELDENEARKKETNDLIEDILENKPSKSIKIEKYCRPSLCNLKSYYNDEHGSKIAESKVIQSKDQNKYDEKVTAEEKNDPFQNMPDSLRSVITCLVNIPKFKDFLKGISSTLTVNRALHKDYPSIRFFIMRYMDGNMERMTQKKNEETSESNVLRQESVSSLLLSVLEIFHEELVAARQNKVLKKICMKDCKLVQKENHTIVSHLFRGHYKKKIECECNHVISETNNFTIVSMNLDEFKEKTLILNYMQPAKDNYITVQRFLFSINNFTTVKRLKEKFSAELKSRNLVDDKENLAIALIKQNKITQILHNDTRIYEAMGEDGLFWLFNVTAADLSLNIISSSLDTYVTREATPTSHVESSIVSSSEFLKIDAMPRPMSKKSSNAIVEVAMQWIDDISAPPFSFLLQLPRISNGLHIYERMSRVIGFHHTNFQKIILTIKNKASQCLICLNSCCHGCPVQMNDKIILAHHYAIALKFAMSSRNQMIECFEDTSILLNQPINLITVDECLEAFMQRKDDFSCPSCAKQSLKSIVFMKKPDILCLHFTRPNTSSSNIPSILPKEILKEILNKKLATMYYSLHSICYFNKQSPFISKDGASTVDNMTMQGENNQISNLIYIKHKTASRKYNNSQSHNMKKMKSREKTRMFLKTKFSPRTGQLSGNMGSVISDLKSNGSSSMGHYTNRSAYSYDQQSLCNCVRCQTLGKFHSQMLQSKSTLRDDSRLESEDSVSIDRSICSSNQSEFPLEKILHKAIRTQDLKTVVKSLNDGADVNMLLKGMSALHLVAGMNEPFGSIFTKILLEHGGDCNLNCSNDGMTPVHIAVMLNHPQILSLLLQAGGVPSLRDSQGRSAFDILVQSEKSNSEYLLRLLRGESQLNDNISNTVSDQHALNDQHALQEDISSNISRLDLEDGMEDKIIGETTFDQVFNTHEITNKQSTFDVNITSNNNTNVDILDESIVSQHFTEIDNSNQSFNGSVMRSWFSWFTCSGRFSKIRRRRNEDRYAVRVVRQGVSKWYNDLRRRLSWS